MKCATTSLYSHLVRPHFVAIPARLKAILEASQDSDGTTVFHKLSPEVPKDNQTSQNAATWL